MTKTQRQKNQFVLNNYSPSIVMYSGQPNVPSFTNNTLEDSILGSSTLDTYLLSILKSILMIRVAHRNNGMAILIS
jgi:hypothetical protein